MLKSSSKKSRGMTLGTEHLGFFLAAVGAEGHVAFDLLAAGCAEAIAALAGGDAIETGGELLARKADHISCQTDGCHANAHKPK